MASKKFDPFAVVRENPHWRDGAGSFYPGELMGRQLLDAEKLLKEALSAVKSGRDTVGHHQRVVDVALDLINSWASLFGAPGGDLIGGNEVLATRERQHIMGSFMAGYNAALLLSLTADGDQEDKDAALEMLNAMFRKEASQKATNARLAPIKERSTAIKDIWASGKFTARDTCADEEWEALGFPSRRAAREALRNTPEPVQGRDAVPSTTRQRGVSVTTKPK